MNKFSARSEAKPLLLLALPVIGTGLVDSSLGFINTVMTGHVSHLALAASVLVNTLIATILVVFWGLLSAISINISHHHGANNKEAISAVFRNGIYLTLGLCIPIMFLLWHMGIVWHWLNESSLIIRPAIAYLHAMVWAIPFDFILVVFMQFFQGIGQPRITLLICLAYVPLTIFANYIFMFGKFGLPAFGLVGAGYGAIAAFGLGNLLCVIFIMTTSYRSYVQFNRWPEIVHIKELLRVGLPMGMMYSLELGFFAAGALIMSKIDSVALASYQIVLQYLWLIMTISGSFSQAVSIRVGWSMGRKEPGRIPSILIISQTLCTIYIGVVGLFYWFFPKLLISLDLGKTTNAHLPIITLATTMFFYAAIFQLVEEARFMLYGVLRGIKDTKVPLYVSALTWWGIMFPLGYYLTFVLHHNNPEGLWQAMIIGATVNFLIFAKRLHHQLRVLY